MGPDGVRGPAGKEGTGRPELDRLLETIRTEGPPPSLEQLAASTHFSRFHLSRLIRDHLGFSLRTLQAALRVERAIDSLLDGRDVIRSQVEAGHESASTFTRSFSRHTGLAPSRYRSQLGLLAAHLMRHMEGTEPVVALRRKFPAGVHSQEVPLRLRVEGAAEGSALFLALNSSILVHGAPDLGIALVRTDSFTVTEIPDGTYYAMVVEVPRSQGLRAFFQMDRNRRQLLRTPITFPLAEPTEVVLGLRERIPTDPPITPNLPRLFFEGVLGQMGVGESNSGQPRGGPLP